MSFTPRGGDGLKSGITDIKFPPLPDCCIQNERRCANIPFPYSVEDPPWYHCPPKCPDFKKPLVKRHEYDYQLMYDSQQIYMQPHYEDRVMPAMAFWFYCDHVPDPPGHDGSMQCRKTLSKESSRPVDTWPPLPRGTCPPPRECEPCGPGPWANPELRRFFYMDCQ